MPLDGNGAPATRICPAPDLSQLLAPSHAEVPTSLLLQQQQQLRIPPLDTSMSVPRFTSLLSPPYALSPIMTAAQIEKQIKQLQLQQQILQQQLLLARQQEQLQHLQKLQQQHQQQQQQTIQSLPQEQQFLTQPQSPLRLNHSRNGSLLQTPHLQTLQTQPLQSQQFSPQKQSQSLTNQVNIPSQSQSGSFQQQLQSKLHKLLQKAQTMEMSPQELKPPSALWASFSMSSGPTLVAPPADHNTSQQLKRTHLTTSAVDLASKKEDKDFLEAEIFTGQPVLDIARPFRHQESHLKELHNQKSRPQESRYRELRPQVSLQRESTPSESDIRRSSRPRKESKRKIESPEAKEYMYVKHRLKKPVADSDAASSATDPEKDVYEEESPPNKLSDIERFLLKQYDTKTGETSMEANAFHSDNYQSI